MTTERTDTSQADTKGNEEQKSRSTRPGTSSGDKTRTSQTLARGLMLLNCFQGPGEQEFGLKDLVKQLGLAQTVVSRLAATLVEYGYLYQNPDTRKYRLGLTAFTLGLTANPYLELKEAARPAMEELARETGESISLTVVNPVGGDGICVASLDSPSQIKLTTVVGSIRPLHRGATRKVLLAYLPDDQKRDYFSRLQMEESEQQALMEELRAITNQGYAYSEEELDEGAFAIAAPVLTRDGVLLGGLAVLGPLFRHESKEISSWIENVQNAATMTSRNLKL